LFFHNAGEIRGCGTHSGVINMQVDKKTITEQKVKLIEQTHANECSVIVRHKTVTVSNLTILMQQYLTK